MKLNLIFIVSSLFTLAACNSEQANQMQRYYQFDNSGNLIRPTNYREWVFAGSAATPLSHDAHALFPDLQFTYIDPVSYKFWQENGYFRDGTIIVKEIAYVGDTQSSVGKGFYTGQYRSLSASVKDSSKFPNTKDNWNYFNWTNREDKKLNNTAIPLGAQCSGCHQANAPDGTVFYNLLSVLRDSKGVGKNAPENKDTRIGLTDGRMKSEM